MGSESLVTVGRPVEAASLLADLRNFTPLLNGCPRDADGISVFCHFLGDVYATVLAACVQALPPGQRDRPPLRINSTGDGALAVFTGEWHFGFGFLAAILLDAALGRCCERFNQSRPRDGLPATSYGIGVESGWVSRVRALAPTRGGGPVLDTVIGQCNNAAARAEGVSKTLDGANTVVSDETVELVAQALFGENFRQKRQDEARCGSDEARVRIHESMAELNRKLCLSYINRHILKGVASPTPLYRLARSSLGAGVARFNELVARLVRGDVSHCAEVMGWLGGQPDLRCGRA
jgi:class 3 adenylate cyclase